MAAITASDVRAAREFLESRGINFPPARFVAASRETGKSFSALLEFIRNLYRGSQDQAGQLRERLHLIMRGNS